RSIRSGRNSVFGEELKILFVCSCCEPLDPCFGTLPLPAQFINDTISRSCPWPSPPQSSATACSKARPLRRTAAGEHGQQRSRGTARSSFRGWAGMLPLEGVLGSG